MDCREVAAEDVAEAYVSGHLSGNEREAFEAHYFVCQACLERLEACAGLHRALVDQLAAARGRARRRPWAWGAVAAIAASLAIVVLRPRTEPSASAGHVADRHPSAASSAPNALSTRIDPPPYSPSAWRDGTTVSEPLRLAMLRYKSGDYAGAARGLEPLSISAPQAPEVHFFLGICLVLAGQTGRGIASLEHTVKLGDTPYLEPALLYLAEALLVKGDRAAARQQLDRAIALHGDLESRARRRLQEIAAAPPQPSPSPGDERR
jgi:tetratricopeptide (TPR) repeat protein